MTYFGMFFSSTPWSAARTQLQEEDSRLQAGKFPPPKASFAGPTLGPVAQSHSRSGLALLEADRGKPRASTSVLVPAQGILRADEETQKASTSSRMSGAPRTHSQNTGPSATAPRFAVAIMAAGKGTRLKSQLPKVLHEVG